MDSISGSGRKRCRHEVDLVMLLKQSVCVLAQRPSPLRVQMRRICCERCRQRRIIAISKNNCPNLSDRARDKALCDECGVCLIIPVNIRDLNNIHVYIVSELNSKTSTRISYKKPSCRKETVRLLRGSVWPDVTGRRYFADLIGFFNNCDVIVPFRCYRTLLFKLLDADTVHLRLIGKFV